MKIFQKEIIIVFIFILRDKYNILTTKGINGKFHFFMPVNDDNRFDSYQISKIVKYLA